MVCICIMQISKAFILTTLFSDPFETNENWLNCIHFTLQIYFSLKLQPYLESLLSVVVGHTASSAQHYENKLTKSLCFCFN